jgi:hypothetical protein
MRFHPRTLPALLLACCLPLAARAAEPPRETSAPREAPDAKIERIVVEDDGARIEETRTRGQTEKVVVKPKDSKAPAYEIVMGDASRDHSADAVANRGNVGKRVWRLFEF